MVGHVPFIGGNAVFLGECARLFVIAAIVGGNRHAGILQGQAEGLADPACATGNNRDTSNLLLPSTSRPMSDYVFATQPANSPDRSIFSMRTPATPACQNGERK